MALRLQVTGDYAATAVARMRWPSLSPKLPCSEGRHHNGSFTYLVSRSFSKLETCQLFCKDREYNLEGYGAKAARVFCH
jgi:hypothetical protein